MMFRIFGVRLKCISALVVICMFSPAAFPAAIPEYSAISVEAETGLVLYEKNADTVRPPASMIKLFQMLLVSEGLEEGRWTLEQPITASRKAQHMGGTQVYLEAGDTFSLEHLMHAVSVASANDAAMAVAEGLWESEEAYLAAMNEMAAELGMESSEFNSVHGLPPDRGEDPDKTTARDMALLGRACVKVPQLLEWTSMRELQFRPGEALKYTTNKLMRRRDDMDGLKTGYIRAAGFCVTATLQKNGIRVISVVMGHTDKKERFDLAERLLDEGVALVRRDVFLPEEGSAVEGIGVGNCEVETTDLFASDGITLLTRRDEFDQIEIVYDHPKSLKAPLKKGDKVGTVSAVLGTTVLAERDLLVTEDLPEAGWGWRIEQTVLGWFGSN